MGFQSKYLQLSKMLNATDYKQIIKSEDCDGLILSNYGQ